MDQVSQDGRPDRRPASKGKGKEGKRAAFNLRKLKKRVEGLDMRYGVPEGNGEGDNGTWGDPDAVNFGFEHGSRDAMLARRKARSTHIEVMQEMKSIERQKKGLAADVGDKDEDEDDDESEVSDSLSEEKVRALERQHADIHPDRFALVPGFPARERLSNYVAMDVFSKAKWNQKEKLPSFLRRMSAFGDYKTACRDAVKDDRPLSTNLHIHQPGAYVRIVLRDVSMADFNLMDHVLKNGPLLAWGLLDGEQKLSLLHFKLARIASDETILDERPLQSKKEIILQVGFRRFLGTPIYSKGKREPFRYVKTFPMGTRMLASIFARVAYVPSPVLGFLAPDNPRRSNSSSAPSDDTLGPLVCTGWLDSVDPFRVCLRHRILSGKTFKVHREKSATIRGLVYSRSDGEFLKDVKLWTHNGLEGKIEKCIGTHGNLKCIFTRKPLVGQPVFMTLYKRQFPSFNLTSVVNSYAFGSCYHDPNSSPWIVMLAAEMGLPAADENLELTAGENLKQLHGL